MLTDILEADGDAMKRTAKSARGGELGIQRRSALPRALEEHCDRVSVGGRSTIMCLPSVRQLVASCTLAAREMYASRTSDAVQTPFSMLETISQAVEQGGQRSTLLTRARGREGLESTTAALKDAPPYCPTQRPTSQKPHL